MSTNCIRCGDKGRYSISLYCAACLDRLRKIHDLAREYESRCRAYDKTVCTGQDIEGNPWPATMEQTHLVSKHAKGVMDDLVRGSDFEPREVKRALLDIQGERRLAFENAVDRSEPEPEDE